MPNPHDQVFPVPDGYVTRDAALFAAALDDQSALLFDDVKDITAAELAWQPAPGMNTIGMLLAHLAVVEVFWTQVGLEGRPHDVKGAIGFAIEDDGMPMPEGGAPPAALEGRDLAWYRDLHARARAYFKNTARLLTEADLDVVRSRLRRDGSATVTHQTRWVLYHQLEHFSGHYGQILLLRHQYRDLKAAVS